MHVLQAFQEPRRCAEAACTGEVVNKYDHTLGEPGHSLHSSQLLTAFTLIRLIHRLDLFKNSCLQMLIAAIFLLVNLSNIPNIKWWHPPNILRNLWIQGWQNLHARDSLAHLECIPPARSLTRITTSAEQPRPNDMNDIYILNYINIIISRRSMEEHW